MAAQGEQIPFLAEMPQLPSHTIPGDCRAEFPSHRNEGSGKVGRTNPYVKKPAAIDTTGLQEGANFLSETEIGLPHRGPAQSVSNANAFAPFTAAAVDDGSATGRAHALPESVLVLALSVMGLKRAFHLLVSWSECPDLSSKMKLAYA